MELTILPFLGRTAAMDDVTGTSTCSTKDGFSSGALPIDARACIGNDRFFFVSEAFIRIRKETVMTIPRTISKGAAACGLVLAMGAMAPAIQAQTNVPSQPVVPMMMMGGYGPGWGGPMMGGQGMGHMMGGQGMGHMMGGPGMGHMMAGPGMMGPQWQNVLDLSAEQREALGKIHEETRQVHRAIMGELLTQQARLRDLFMAQPIDSEAVAGAAKTISELRQRFLDSASVAHKNMRAVLTPEQLERLQALWPKAPVAAE